jgi:hypothetical protein
MWFTGKNYYNLADEKDRNFIFYDCYNHIWKPGLKLLHATCLQLGLYCVIGDVFGCMVRLKHIKCFYERWGKPARVPKLTWFKGAQAGKFPIQTH